MAHVLWAPNSYNVRRTVTVCSGVYGVVRAITGDRFRHGNQQYVMSRFKGRGFSIISRVLVAGRQLVAPNWSGPDSRLREWLVGVETRSWGHSAKSIKYRQASSLAQQSACHCAA